MKKKENLNIQKGHWGPRLRQKEEKGIEMKKTKEKKGYLVAQHFLLRAQHQRCEARRETYMYTYIRFKV